MVSIKLFGAATLTVEDEVVTGPPAQRHRLALLALLATSPSRALTRDKLMAYLWPERDTRSARKLLNQSVYELRKELGEAVILSVAEELRLDTNRMFCDIVAFERALEVGELERAVELYSGPFLDGFFVDRTSNFQQWVEGERRRLADCFSRALEGLAESAEERGDLRGAVEFWKALAAHEPYDSRVALRLMEALTAAGNPAGALKHAADHERLLEDELGIDPPPELGELADRLGTAPSRVPPRREDKKSSLRGPASTPRVSSAGPWERGSAAPAAWRTESDGPEQGWSESRRVCAAVVLAAAVAVGVWWAFMPSDSSRDSEGQAIQLGDIERVVAREVERHMGGEEAVANRNARTGSIAAYELYLRGTDPAMLRSASTAWEAVGHLRRAVALDSTYAAPWAGLACLYLRVSGTAVTSHSRGELYQMAEQAALRAVAADDSLSEAHASLGLVRMAGFDLSAAEEHLRRAIELDPRSTRPREWLVTVHLAMGQPGVAMDVAREALELNPLSPTANAEMARALGSAGRCDDALVRLRELGSLQPALLRAGTIAAHCYIRTGRLQEAVAVLREQAEGSSDIHSLALLGHVLARAGQQQEALRILERFESRRRGPEGGAFPVAIIEAGLGHRDGALQWLERGFDDGSLMGTPLHLQILRTLAEVLREDSRYGALRERLGLAELPSES